MSTEAISDTTTNPISEYAKQVNDEKEQKRLAYEAAMQQLEQTQSIFKKIETAYINAKKASENGENIANFDSLKNNYNSALNSTTSASNSVDIRRSSYQDSIFFSGKINMQESIASAILG